MPGRNAEQNGDRRSCDRHHYQAFLFPSRREIHLPPPHELFGATSTPSSSREHRNASRGDARPLRLMRVELVKEDSPPWGRPLTIAIRRLDPSNDVGLVSNVVCWFFLPSNQPSCRGLTQHCPYGL